MAIENPIINLISGRMEKHLNARQGDTFYDSTHAELVVVGKW